MNKKQAEQIAGTLSNTSKIPCKSYSIPAKYCLTGGKLRTVKDSVCSKCYACKGCYVWGNVQTALQKRYQSIFSDKWIDAMVVLITHATKTIKVFRWHDSGDIQNIEHLYKICEIARKLPHIAFWLPTKEKTIVELYSNKYVIPHNLIIRVSAPMIDGAVPIAPNTSTVSKDREYNFTCPATLGKNNGKCGECRACWDKSIKNVAYKLH